MNVYKYTTENKYVSAGPTNLFNAAKILLVDITPHVECGDSGNIHFKHTLNGHTPFHADVDIESRVPMHTDTTTRTAGLMVESTSDEPFIVERVLQKLFHPQRQQYEFLVKWRGYTAAESTWELPSNIPDEKLEELDRQQQEGTRPASRREGLRESRRAPVRKDFIRSF